MAKILTMPVRENLLGRWSSEGKVLEMPERQPELPPVNWMNFPPYFPLDDGA